MAGTKGQWQFRAVVHPFENGVVNAKWPVHKRPTLHWLSQEAQSVTLRGGPAICWYGQLQLHTWLNLFSTTGKILGIESVILSFGLFLSENLSTVQYCHGSVLNLCLLLCNYRVSGGRTKSENITLYTHNDLLHKRKKKKILWPPKLYGVFEVCGALGWKSCFGNLSC